MARQPVGLVVRGKDDGQGRERVGSGVGRVTDDVCWLHFLAKSEERGEHRSENAQHKKCQAHKEGYSV